jgi:hypothetical protein
VAVWQWVHRMSYVIAVILSGRNVKIGAQLTGEKSEIKVAGWQWQTGVAVARGVAVAVWQWDGRTSQVIAVILSGRMVAIGGGSWRVCVCVCVCVSVAVLLF